MAFNDIVKSILVEDTPAPAEQGINRIMNTAMQGGDKYKSKFEYDVGKQYTPDMIPQLLEQINQAVGKAFVSSKEDITKYLSLTNKVIILTRNAENESWPRFIPGPIALEMIEKGPDSIMQNIFQYSKIFREYSHLLKINWPSGNSGKDPDTMFAFSSSKPLATEGSTDSEEIKNLAKWAEWLKSKRAESWIIADHSVDNLGVD